MIEVVNIRNGKYDVYGGRPRGGKDPRDCKVEEYGWLGNPFRVTHEAERESSIMQFKKYFWKRINEDVEYREAVLALAGKRVACFCKPKSCHLDVIADWFRAGCPLK
jgi:hypothetical protein